MDVPTFGLPRQAVAVLLIVFGLLIFLVPALLPWLVGLLLIVVGVAWLVGEGGWTTRPARRTRYAPPRF